MKKTNLVFGIALLLVIISSGLWADDPTINVQGVLRDAEGNAVADGQQPMVFKFYDADTAGNQIGSWSESITVDVLNGIYNVRLGSSSPLTNLAFDTTYYLEITVDGTIMTPRLPLSLTPYSLSVRGIDNVFPSTGKVGIGTTSPASTLHVLDENNDTRSTIERSTESDEAFLQFRTGGSNKALIGLDNGMEDLSIYSYDGAGRMMTFDGSTGNVGIGVADPDMELEINGHLHISGADGTGYENVIDGDLQLSDLYAVDGIGIGSTSGISGLDISKRYSLGWAGWYSSIKLSNSNNQSIHHSGTGLFLGFNTNDIFYFGNEVDEDYYMWLGTTGLSVDGEVNAPLINTDIINLSAQNSCDCDDSSDAGKIRYDSTNGNFYGCSNDANDNGTPGDYGWVKLNN
jgi:hypothetical protein